MDGKTHDFGICKIQKEECIREVKNVSFSNYQILL